MQPRPRSVEQQRRLRVAPLGLLLLGWGLGVGPLAHALIAHGDPVPRDSGDQRWVDHAHETRRSPPPSAPAHHHAPGTLEHLQLAVASAVVVLAVARVVLRLTLAPASVWPAPTLRRWRLPEVPCGP